MKPILLGAVVAALMFAATCATPVHAERTGVKTLKGLKGVQVLIEDIDADLAAAGVNKDTLQSNVEGQLKDANITVYDDDQWKADTAHPYLYVRVNSIKSNDEKFFAFSLDIELHQDVTLTRDSDIDTLATTWETGSFGIIEADQAKRIYKSVTKEVAEFVEDFNAQNADTAMRGSVPSHSAKAASAPTHARHVLVGLAHPRDTHRIASAK
jgi:hypothetical protein